jgi:sortase (surface protein transpeptidase)
MAASTVLFICLMLGTVAQIKAGSRIDFAFAAAEASSAVPAVLPAPITPVSADVVPVVSVPIIKDLRPRTITIPSIDLRREIIDIGVTSSGNLDVPPNYTQVGWYKDGTLPGHIGSAVLDGHVDNGASVPGPFKRLREVKIGDEISITSADRTIQTFIVTGADVYPTDQFPGDLVFHDKSGALVKIITCHGRFVPSMDTYDQRLIVTAKLADR